jgi:hypothetical protein
MFIKRLKVPQTLFIPAPDNILRYIMISLRNTIFYTFDCNCHIRKVEENQFYPVAHLLPFRNHLSICLTAPAPFGPAIITTFRSLAIFHLIMPQLIAKSFILLFLSHVPHVPGGALGIRGDWIYLYHIVVIFPLRNYSTSALPSFRPLVLLTIELVCFAFRVSRFQTFKLLTF